MNVDKLKKVFREVKKQFKLDFAYTNVDNLGDCNSCVCYTLGKKFGDNGRGMYLKFWRHGMNRSTRPLESLNSIYINHCFDDDEKLGNDVVNYLRKYYKVEDDFSLAKSIKIEEV